MAVRPLSIFVALALVAVSGACLAAAEDRSLQSPVVRVEVAVDPFSAGPAMLDELNSRQPWTAYETEVERRLRLGSTGTGFFVNSEGDLVTNAHVLLSGVRYRGLAFTRSEWDSLARLLTTIRTAWVTVGEGEEARCYAAAPRVVSEDLDLAVLRVSMPPGEEPDFAFLPIASSDQLRVGQPITALGFPADEFQASGGKILSLIRGSRVHEEMRLVKRTSTETGATSVTVSGTSTGPVVRLQHSAPTGHGSSGGPVLDSRNRVVGVAYALLADRSQPAALEASENGLNLAITSNVLKRFLRDHAVKYAEAEQ